MSVYHFVICELMNITDPDNNAAQFTTFLV